MSKHFSLRRSVRACLRACVERKRERPRGERARESERERARLPPSCTQHSGGKARDADNCGAPSRCFRMDCICIVTTKVWPENSKGFTGTVNQSLAGLSMWMSHFCSVVVVVTSVMLVRTRFSNVLSYYLRLSTTLECLLLADFTSLTTYVYIFKNIYHHLCWAFSFWFLVEMRFSYLT